MVDWYCIAYIGVQRGWGGGTIYDALLEGKELFCAAFGSIFFTHSLCSGLPMALAPCALLSQ